MKENCATETTMTNRIKTSRTAFLNFRSTGKLLAAGLFLCGVLMHAQNRPDRRNDRTDYDRSDNGVSAGGKWTEYRAEDRMTAAKRVRFELPAENTGDGDTDQARIFLYCTDGKLNLADFRPNVRIGRPDWPGPHRLTAEEALQIVGKGAGTGVALAWFFTQAL